MESLPSSLPTHDATPNFLLTLARLGNKLCCLAILLRRCFDKYGSMPTDRVTSHGAPADNENQGRRPSRHYVHEHDVSVDETYYLGRHTGKYYLPSLSLAT